MKTKISKTIISVVTICFSVAGFSQNTPISLEQAISMAKKNSSELKIADKEIEKQNTLKKAAFQADPLQIQYQGGQFNSKDFDNNISLQQYFPIGGATKANRQLQEELAKLAERQKALSEYEIEKAVTLSYYQYLYGVSQQKLNNELYDIYSKFLKNAELRFNTGESGKIEVISAKAKVKEIETLKGQLEYDLARYQNQFQYFLQTTDDVIPDVATDLEYNAQTKESEKAQGLVIGFYEQQANVYEKEMQTFKAQRMPKLGLGYFIQSLDKELYFQGFTAGLQIPLFGSVNMTRARASEISRSQAQLQVEKTQMTFGLQQQHLRNEFEKYKKGVDYYKKEGLQFAEQIIVTSQKSYANGDMSYWTYISFLNQAIDIKKQFADSVNLYNQSAIQLQYPTLITN